MMEPVLYILMRQDLQSLNPGKAMAQAAHAANLFQSKVLEAPPDIRQLYLEWVEHRHFGTTVVLGCKEWHINRMLAMRSTNNMMMDVVIDPTYPIRDGEITHLINLPTCAYVFGDKKHADVQFMVHGLGLHP